MKKLTKALAFLLALSMFIVGCGTDLGQTAETTVETDGEGTSTASTIPIITAPVDSSKADETTETEDTSASSSSTDDPEKMIALTFDDGPATNGKDGKCSTERILDVLEKYGAKATFFIQGVNLTYAEFKERNTGLLKREVELGMEIGNHSFDHPYFNKISASEIQEQISKCNATIRETLGDDFEIKIMRTPGGAKKQATKDAIDMPIILWSIDTRDWDTQDADNTYNVVMSEVGAGSVILMHDTYQATADAVEMIVPALIEKGYKLVTISELFEAWGNKLENHQTYYRPKRIDTSTTAE